MPKPGIVKLPANIYPKLQDKYTEHELKHILVLTAMDINNGGLQVFQTVPELMKNNEVISGKDVALLAFPIVNNAIKSEYVHAKLICLLNNASGEQKEQHDYLLTTVFIADDKNKNFKLADVFFGEPENGAWAKDADVELFAKSMNIPYYYNKEETKHA